MIIDKKKILVRVLSAFIAFVFVQSSFFKFSNAPETQYIFGVLDLWAADIFGVEDLFAPSGVFSAYVIATFELIASILLIIGVLTVYKALIPLGALLAISIITGAIFFHLFTPLGINVQGDGGTLFFMACGIWISSAVLIVLHAKNLCRLIKALKAEG